jgi:LacI family repressor for deo operon, udp, cdd, tsx, nupC, and nupG
VVVPNLANHYFYAIIKRMLHGAVRDGYRLLVAYSDESLAAERALGANLLRQTDGLILVLAAGGVECAARVRRHR